MIKLLVQLFFIVLLQENIFIPIDSWNRLDISSIHLTNIGKFGILRKVRTNVPEHYHTGIDIIRPNNNYKAEPVYPIAPGRVISKRTDGPYANLIIEHDINGVKCWSLYEHIAGIIVNVENMVDPHTPIARFMNNDELNRFGWQFDHLHLEILKIKPLAIKPNKANPERFFNSYSLICYSLNDLHKYYFDPVIFLKTNQK